MVALLNNAPIIDDNNWEHFSRPVVGGKPKGRGYKGMWQPRCQTPQPFEALGIPLIAEADVDDYIDQREKDHSTHIELAKEFNLICLNQSNTNYCWGNGPTYGMEYMELRANNFVTYLSPASVCAQVKGYKNYGGWGSQWLEWAKIHGINEVGDWPANYWKDRTYATPDNKERAKRHTVLEYYKLSNWAEVVSCILADIPVGVGYNWWSHEVCGVWLRRKTHNLIFRNSWGMSYGEDGYGELSGSRKYPNDAVAVIVSTAA